MWAREDKQLLDLREKVHVYIINVCNMTFTIWGVLLARLQRISITIPVDLLGELDTLCHLEHKKSQ
jgi:hypothetical protein